MFIDDLILEQAARPIAVRVWVPDRAMAVLGAGNDPGRELFAERCREAGIPVLKRAGGGGTVILYPGCVIVSLGCWVARQFQNSFYFGKINAAVIDALGRGDEAFRALGQDGFSDITWGDRKVAGTSLFRSKHYLLYQASLIVDLDIGLLNLYLPHPSKEPAYRAGKSHADFLTGLRSLSPRQSPADAASFLGENIENSLSAILADDLIPPQPSHVPHLLKRASRGVSDT